MLRHLTALLLLAFCAGALSAESFAQADRALRAAETAFNAKLTGVVADDTPANRLLLKREWRAQQVWAAAYLTQHPGATHAALHHPALGARDVPLRFDFVPLARGAVLVATRDVETGTIFILAPRAGRLVSIWSITDARAPRALIGGIELRNWSADCSIAQPRPKYCRVLAGQIGALPPEGDGTVHFYIEGTYAQDMGATVANQFTIWDWDGAKATPRYLKTYLVMTDQPIGLRRHGETIILRMKGDWRHFYSCGSCNGRQRDLTLQLTPTGVRELGMRSVHPELDRIDLLIDRVLAGKPTRDIASAQAAATIRAQLSDNIAQMKDPKEADTAPLLGMLMNYRITHQRKATQVCLDADQITDRFTLVGRRIVEVKPVTSGSCGGPGSDA